MRRLPDCTARVISCAHGARLPSASGFTESGLMMKRKLCELSIPLNAAASHASAGRISRLSSHTVFPADSSAVRSRIAKLRSTLEYDRREHAVPRVALPVGLLEILAVDVVILAGAEIEALGLVEDGPQRGHLIDLLYIRHGLRRLALRERVDLVAMQHHARRVLGDACRSGIFVSVGVPALFATLRIAMRSPLVVACSRSSAVRGFVMPTVSEMPVVSSWMKRPAIMQSVSPSSRELPSSIASMR
jgi:hypothetical protein